VDEMMPSVQRIEPYIVQTLATECVRDMSHPIRWRWKPMGCNYTSTTYKDHTR